MNATPTPRPVPAGRAPSAGTAASTLAGITLTRLLRGKALWLCALFAALPVGFGAIMHGLRITPFYNDIFVLWRVILALLAAMLVASSIGEDIEDRVHVRNITCKAYA